MIHHLLVGIIALALAPVASETTTIAGKKGASCTKDTKRVYEDTRGKFKVTVCWHSAGDPALNGTEIIVDASHGKSRMSWRQVADVYTIEAVKAEKAPDNERLLVVNTSEHTMDDDSQVVTRKAVFALKLALDNNGALSKQLSVVRRK